MITTYVSFQALEEGGYEDEEDTEMMDQDVRSYLLFLNFLFHHNKQQDKILPF